MAILSLLRSKKIVWATFFSALAIVLFSISGSITFSNDDHKDMGSSSDAEVVSVATEVNSSNMEVGTYRVMRIWNNTPLVTLNNITEKKFRDSCTEDKKKLWSNITCSWEKTKNSTNNTGSTENDELYTLNMSSGMIACGNPDKSDYIKYNPKNNKITIRKSDCNKKGGLIWIVCKNKATDIKSISIFKKWYKLSCRPPVTLGTYMKYINDALSPSEVKQNVSKTYAYLKCRANLNSSEHYNFGHHTNYNQSFRCTWDGTEIYSYTPTVKEKITCVFSGATTIGNFCSTTIGSKSYSCKSTRTNSCKIELIGKKWTKLTWASTFGASQESILDGKNKTITFSDTNLPPPIPTGTYKLYLSGSTTPTTTKTNITQDDALASCMTTEASIDAKTSIQCTWNDATIYSRIIVTSQVTCAFSWVTTTESSCTAYNYSGYTCKGFTGCSMSISGLEWFKVTWVANNNLDYPITTVLSTENQTITFPVP